MSQIIISYRPENESPPRSGLLRFSDKNGKFTLYPGTRSYPEEIRNHPDYARYVKVGAIVEKTPEDLKPAGVVATIADLSIDDALPIIERESNLKLLNSWRDNDARKGIKNAISRRIQEVENGIA